MSKRGRPAAQPAEPAKIVTDDITPVEGEQVKPESVNENIQEHEQSAQSGVEPSEVQENEAPQQPAASPDEESAPAPETEANEVNEAETADPAPGEGGVSEGPGSGEDLANKMAEMFGGYKPVDFRPQAEKEADREPGFVYVHKKSDPKDKTRFTETTWGRMVKQADGSREGWVVDVEVPAEILAFRAAQNAEHAPDNE